MQHAEMLASEQATAAVPLPPLVPGLPLIGSGLEMLRDLPGFLVANYRRYGPIYRIRTPKEVLTVMVGQEANQFVAQADGDLLRSREFWGEYAQEMGSPNQILGLNGEQHSWHRKMLKPSFSRTAATDRIPDLITVVREHVRHLQQGQRVPVVELFQRIVSDQLGLLMLGQRPGEYLDDIRRTVRYTINTTVVHQWPTLALHLPAYQRSKRRQRLFAQQLIDARRATPSAYPEDDFIILLLRAQAERPHHMTEADLVFSALSPYVAGLDTVASTCAFMLYHLLANPAQRARVQAEVDAVFTGEPTAEALRRLPALHGAAMETMRLNPVTIAMQRNATRPFVFGGYRVDRGQPILSAIGMTHYLPEHFPDPERFDIDRYHEPRNEHRVRGVYSPFGVGPHTCLGAGLAEVQIAVTMGALLASARLELEPGYTLKTTIDPNPTPGRSFRVQLVSHAA
ncbi:MAG TPA: cytochrome P450 [Roseiflexaceae bacterium]|nr:cytochrome P450 [Roseiflexaceae bacterium]